MTSIMLSKTTAKYRQQMSETLLWQSYGHIYERDVFYVQTKKADCVVAALVNAVSYFLRRRRRGFTDRNQ